MTICRKTRKRRSIRLTATPYPAVALVRFKIYEMAKRKIEFFTAGCPVCEPVVRMVRSMACGSCKVTVYNLAEQCDTKECIAKVKEYNITSLPAVVVNGELLSCCAGRGVSHKPLELATLPKPVESLTLKPISYENNQPRDAVLH